MKKIIILAVLFGFVVSAQAQKIVKLKFENSAMRHVWFSDKPVSQVPDNAMSVEDREIEVKPSAVSAETMLWIWDEQSNNIASRKVSQLGSEWFVKPTDFGWLGNVEIKIEHAGDPVASASVRINDSIRAIDQLVDPSALGVITAFCLKPGTIRVMVTYRSEGKMRDPLRQAFELALKRSQPMMKLVVSIPEKVETVAQKSSASTATTDSPQASEENSTGRFILMLVIIAGIGTGIYFALKYFKNNPDSVQEQLNKFGLKAPDDGGLDPVAKVGTVAPLTPEPMKPIVLDDAAPTPITTPSPPVNSGYTSINKPQLVRESGEVIDLPEGEARIGRESPCELVLPGESTVSRHHATLRRDGDQVFLTDMGSTNGTFVNGIPVAAEVQLKPGDMVQFGAVKTRFEG